MSEAVTTQNNGFMARQVASRFNYWAGYVSNTALVLWMASHALTNDFSSLLSWQQWVTYVAAGYLFWTLVEYLFHRFLYHGDEHSPMTKGHAAHHDAPKSLLGIPWYFTLVGMVTLFEIFAYFFNPASTGVFMAVAWAGYISYCLMHHAVHHWNFQSAWFRDLRRHHYIHHAYPDRNWGVTTMLWDRVFRSHNGAPSQGSATHETHR